MLMASCFKFSEMRGCVRKQNDFTDSAVQSLGSPRLMPNELRATQAVGAYKQAACHEKVGGQHREL